MDVAHPQSACPVCVRRPYVPSAAPQELGRWYSSQEGQQFKVMLGYRASEKPGGATGAPVSKQQKT